MPEYPGMYAVSAAQLYEPNAVVANGDRLVTSAPLAGISNSTSATFTFWIKLTSSTDHVLIVFYNTGGSSTRMNCIIRPTGEVDIFARNSTPATILDMQTTDAALQLGVEYRIAITIDMTTQANTKVWVNEVEKTLTFGTFVPDGVIQFATDDIVPIFGNLTVPAFDAEIADLWFDTRVITSGDLSKFFTAGGCLAWKGNNGELPFSAAPLIYLSGPTGSWHTNKGTGGGFTVSHGALATSGNPPCGGPMPIAPVEAIVFSEVANLKRDLKGSTADPIDAASVFVPDGSNRLILDLICNSNTEQVLTDVLDPGGGAASLTQVEEQIATTVTVAEIWRLLEASMLSTGVYSLRADIDGAAIDLFRQIVVLENAAQTTTQDGNSGTSINQLIVSATRASGSFPIGSMVYVVVTDGDGGATYSMSGDASLVRQDISGWLGGNGHAYGKGILSSAKATVSVTIDLTATVNRLAGVIVVVEPASGADLETVATVPAELDWTDQGEVISEAPGTWYARLNDATGLHPVGFVALDNQVNFYFAASDGDRVSDGGVAFRRVGAATSADGLSWNVITPHMIEFDQGGGNVEEEGVWAGGVFRDSAGNWSIASGALEEVGPTSVEINGYEHTSSNGTSWTPSAAPFGAIILPNEAGEAGPFFAGNDGSGDETWPTAIWYDEARGRWQMIYIAKNDTENNADWSLYHADADTLDGFTEANSRAFLLRANNPFSAGGEFMSACIVDRGQGNLEVFASCLNAANTASAIVRIPISNQDFINGKGTPVVFYDFTGDAASHIDASIGIYKDQWLMMYRRANTDGSYYLKTAPVS